MLNATKHVTHIASIYVMNNKLWATNIPMKNTPRDCHESQFGKQPIAKANRQL